MVLWSSPLAVYRANEAIPFLSISNINRNILADPPLPYDATRGQHQPVQAPSVRSVVPSPDNLDVPIPTSSFEKYVIDSFNELKQDFRRQDEHFERQDEHFQRQDGHFQRQDGHFQRQDEHLQRQDGHFQRLERNLDAILDKFEDMHADLKSLLELSIQLQKSFEQAVVDARARRADGINVREVISMQKCTSEASVAHQPCVRSIQVNH
jgi:hypothetical protein